MNRPPQSAKRIVNQEKIEEREIWHKLVVKIISWSDPALCLLQSEKITPLEWKTYYSSTLVNCGPAGKENALIRLQKTREIISHNSGFE